MDFLKKYECKGQMNIFDLQEKKEKVALNRKKDIIKTIQNISGKYSLYEVFTDWIRCSALAISNSCQMIHDKVWQERESMYIDTMKKYTLEERLKFIEMFNMLAETLEFEMTDVLGQIYMEAEMGSKAAGQFFTPYHLSKLCAELSVELDENEKCVINEPSCGGGGMIIATASVLKEKGINYQQVMEVVAQDFDWKGVYMCYLQLSLLGISAVCVQGDTLANPHIPGKTEASHILYTPARMGVLL